MEAIGTASPGSVRGEKESQISPRREVSLRQRSLGSSYGSQ